MKTVKGQSESSENHPGGRLDGYRSPSMWGKLAKWKAEKENLKRKSIMKTTSRQPFKVGSTLNRRSKVPARASEKIKLLVESNLTTHWNYRTSPRYSSCRKSISSVKKPEKNQSAKKPDQARRETITLSVGKKMVPAKNSNSQLNVKDSDEKNLKVLPKQSQKPKDKQLHNISTQKPTRFSKPDTTLKSKDIQRRGTSSQKTLTNGKLNAWNLERKLYKKQVEDKRTKPSSRDWTSSTRSGEQTKMRLKLEQWLLAKGKTPSQTTRLLKTPKVTSRVTQQVQDKISTTSCSNVLTVEEAMDACKDLLKEGCPPEYLSEWLDRLNAKLPSLQQMESFVSCKNLVQFACNDVGMTSHSPDSSYNLPGQLKEDLADVGKPVSCQRQKSRRSSYQLLSPCERAEESSVLKYQVREATPYFKRIHQALGQTSSTSSAMIVTPVRRSVRLSKRKSVSFASRQNSQLDTCVDSLSELPSGQAVQVILRSNRALEKEFGMVDEDSEN